MKKSDQISIAIVRHHRIYAANMHHGLSEPAASREVMEEVEIVGFSYAKGQLATPQAAG